MSGHNHYASCTCGWCLTRHRTGIGKPIYAREAQCAYFATYESFTVPNAACPVCGSSVFFYQSPSGGRVFFDELGPPWPKHPCTDNSTIPVPRTSGKSGARRRPPAWQKSGWEPVEMKSSLMQGSWHLIPLQSLLSGKRFDVFSPTSFRAVGEICAFMRPWDANGWSEISYVNLNATARENLIPIFRAKLFAGVSAGAAVLRRKAATGR